MMRMKRRRRMKPWGLRRRWEMIRAVLEACDPPLAAQLYDMHCDAVAACLRSVPLTTIPTDSHRRIECL
jgi:hypothetical protein